MAILRTASDARRLSTSARPLLASPASFDGTLEQLAERHILPNIPSAKSILEFHDGLVQYVERSDAVFLLRMIPGTQRREIYTTTSGVRFKATDNAPAWWIHAALAQGFTIAPDAFAEVMATLPAHMFDVPRLSAPTASQAGWHIAHIFDVKDRRTDFEHWGRGDVIGRFVRSVHPCNYFLLPKVDWQRWGGDSRVIGYFAELYAGRYAEVWPKFLKLARVTTDALHRVAGPILYSYAAGAQKSIAMSTAPASIVESAEDEPTPAAEYRASRLTFKRDVIEPLKDGQKFRVITPLGTFVMTKEEFHHDFQNVAESRSYCDAGAYNYSSVPRKAEKYRVATSIPISGKQ